MTPRESPTYKPDNFDMLPALFRRQLFKAENKTQLNCLREGRESLTPVKSGKPDNLMRQCGQYYFSG
jgi:hypothetical protein